MAATMESGLKVRACHLPEHHIQDVAKERYFSVQPDSAGYRNLSQNHVFQQPHEQSRDRITWWPIILTAVVTAVVVGAAVGGGLGSELKASRDREARLSGGGAANASQATTTVTVTASTSSAVPTTSDGLLLNYTASAPGMIYSLALPDCPSRDGESYETHYWSGIRSQRFSISCGQEWGGGDIGPIVAYSLDDCMEACNSVNYYQGVTVCTRVAYHAQMRYDGISQPLNCFLKNCSATTYANEPSGPAYQWHLNVASAGLTSEAC